MVLPDPGMPGNFGTPGIPPPPNKESMHTDDDDIIAAANIISMFNVYYKVIFLLKN
jgi:hypothetical protein